MTQIVTIIVGLGVIYIGLVDVAKMKRWIK